MCLSEDAVQVFAEAPTVALLAFVGVVVADDVYPSYSAVLGGPIVYSANQVHIVVVSRLGRTEDDVTRHVFRC